MCVIYHSVTWVLWKNICSGIIVNIRFPVICVVKVSVVRVAPQNTTVYILESVLTSVMCVIIPLPRGVLWILIIVSILESVLSSVMCVANHFVISILLQYIRSLILKSIHLFVMHVTDHSDAANNLAHTFPYTVWNVCSALVCVSDQDCLAKFLKWNWDKVTQITYCWTRHQLNLVSLSITGTQLGSLTLELQTTKTCV